MCLTGKLVVSFSCLLPFAFLFFPLVSGSVLLVITSSKTGLLRFFSLRADSTRI